MPTLHHLACTGKDWIQHAPIPQDLLEMLVCYGMLFVVCTFTADMWLALRPCVYTADMPTLMRSLYDLVKAIYCVFCLGHVTSARVV